MSFNLVVLTGRLVREPELKHSASGTAYCRFTIAVNRAFDKEKTDFISCTAFGKTAELIAEYVKKGHQLGVQGRIQQDIYEKDGKTEYKTGVTVDKVEFYRDWETDRKSTRLNSSHSAKSRMPSSA